MKMKDLALAQVRRGERFTLDGVEFVKLEDDLDAAFAVAADTLPECCQFYGYDPSNPVDPDILPWWRMCWPAGWPRRSAWAAWAGCCRRSTCTSPETAHTTTSPRNGKAGRPGTGPWKARMRGEKFGADHYFRLNGTAQRFSVR